MIGKCYNLKMYINIDKLYTYVVKHDTGFSPNPFNGYCTLACCKPRIRKSIGQSFEADKSTWVIGITPANNGLGNKLLYAMRVTEVLTFSDYFYDNRFQSKKPKYNQGLPLVHKCGDNIYEPLNTGYKQLPSMHSNKTPCGHVVNKDNLVRDLSGEYVLISDLYIYLGIDAIEIPEFINDIKVGRGHKCNFPENTLGLVSQFLGNIFDEYRDTNHRPHKWKENDNSWDI